MELKEVRKINANRVRSMCIKDDYYTRGTVDEYVTILEFCDNCDGSLKSIKHIAVDIYEHSDKERILYECGYKDDEIIKSIMTNIINECSFTWVE